MPLESTALRRWPSSRISVLLPALSPNPRRSTVASVASGPESVRTSMPARERSRSGRVASGDASISARSMTEILAGIRESVSVKRVAVTITVAGAASCAAAVIACAQARMTAAQTACCCMKITPSCRQAFPQCRLMDQGIFGGIGKDNARHRSPRRLRSLSVAGLRARQS